MATNFPASLDTLTNPTSSDSLSSPSHSAQHANVNDAVEALQAKVGADSSAVTSSHDYKIAQLEGRDTAGLVHISRTTIGSAVSSVTVSSAFSADYDVYRVLVNLEAGSADGQSWFLTFGSTSTNYYSVKWGYRWSGGSLVSLVENGAYMDIGAFSSTAGGSLSIDIYDPFATDQTKVNGTNSYARVTASTTGGALSCAGLLNDTTSYTAFTLAANSGTMTGGTIDVYGYAKA